MSNINSLTVCILQQFMHDILVLIIIIMKKEKKENPQSLTLNPRNLHCYYRQPVSVNFKPQKDGENENTYIVRPVYNNDGNFFTPAFINPYFEKIDHASFPTFLKYEHKQFQRRLALCQSSSDKSKIQFQGKDDSICFVCENFYDGYNQHIIEPYHLRLIEQNPTNKYIQELCDKFKPKKSERKTQKKERKKRELQKETNI